jgi:hypothetical protein
MPDTDQTQAKLIQADVKHYILRTINSLSLFEMSKNCLSITVPIYEKGDKKLTVVIIKAYHCYQLHTQFYAISTSQG